MKKNTPACVTPQEISRVMSAIARIPSTLRSEQSRINGAKNKTFRGGRPKKINKNNP